MKEVTITSLATSLVHRVIYVQPPPTLDQVRSTKIVVFVTFSDRNHLDGEVAIENAVTIQRAYG